jgi:outer membrane lipoprotein SlyB
MKLTSLVFVIVYLITFSVSVTSGQAILKPGSLVCKSYQDLIMAKEMVANDPQFASNALHRTGLCVLSSPYQEQYINLLDKKNYGHQIQFLNDPTRHWVLNESIISNSQMTPAKSEKIVIYPASGQSINELLADKSECKSNAFQQTGYSEDSQITNTTNTFVPPPIYSQESESLGTSIAGGAAAGAIGGAIAGEPGKGAAIGAVAGALFGGVERAQRQEEEAEWRRQYQSMQNYQMQEQNQNNLVSKKQSDFIFKACMENRGYSVK